MAKTDEEKIAIVGGGIAGLFCALILQRQQKSVFLFDTSDRLGGRIRTLRLDKHNEPLTKKTWNANNLEFYVEFGPMRVELDKQLLLKALLNYLDIKPKSPSTAEADAHLVDFASYASPTSSHDPQYDLRSEEVGKTPLELLRMALLRVIVSVEVKSEIPDFADKKEKLVKRIQLAAAVQQPVDPIFVEWMKNELNEDDYWEIQTKGYIGDVPLYAIGFWNLLSDYLSHDATTKLRDLGTFYHLLPENPNAAEWLVWWLIGFSISERLQGVFGGMECIVDKLEDRLDKKVIINKDSWVKRLEPTVSKKLKLVFDANKRPTEQSILENEYDRVILAIPKTALQQVERESKEAFSQETEIKGLLDSAFGFPMIKMFVVVKERWWEEETRANRFATRVPTRELHYWKGKTENSKQGLIMAYTDRPASSFWANYVPAGPQIDAHRPIEKPLPAGLRSRLKKKVAQYLNENNLPEITSDDIVWYGIRDWDREPYGGANHAWRPDRKYWVVMRRLADIGGKSKSSIHICGEAYSDYHGFMEGSLRSAAYVLHRILDKNTDGKFETLAWLNDEDLRVEKHYLNALRKWSENLDSVPQNAPFLD